MDILMNESVGGANALPPFVAKTYEMVDDPSSNLIVSWSSSSKSFIVWKPPEFSRDLLPKFFKHNNFSSFVRQLNTYGFRKIDPELWEFANDDFIRGQPHRLKNIHRRKPVHSHSAHNQVHGISSPLTESERVGYQDDIGRLKCEKEALHLELERKVRLREEHKLQAQGLQQQMECLSERQEEMVYFLARILDRPELVLSSTPSLTTRNRKRRLLTTDCLQQEAEKEANQLRASVVGSKDTICPSLNSETIDLMESSITRWEEIIYQVGRSCGGDIVAEIDLPLEEAVIYPEKRISPTREFTDKSSTFELDESRGCADSPTVSFLQLNIDVPSKDTEADMNHEGTVQSPEVMQSAEVLQLSARASEAVADARIMTTKPSGANDTFWAQFLTEHPGSSNVPEAQVEKYESDIRKQNDPSKSWWNVTNVNNLAEQMGHLTPAERT